MVSDEFDLATSAEVSSIIADRQFDGNKPDVQSISDPLSQTTLHKPDSPSPKRAAQEVCQVMSRNYRLFLENSSVSAMKKVTRPIDTNRRDRNVSYHHEVKVRFSSSFLNRGLMARFYANTIGGFNFSHSLATVRIVPDNTGIFHDVRVGDINTVVRRLSNGEDSPNNTGRYGCSLLAMVSRSNYQNPPFLTIQADLIEI